MHSIESFSDLFVDACIRGEQDELLLLSLYGHESSVIQFMAALSVPRDKGTPLAGGKSCFTLLEADQHQTVYVPDPERIRKFTGQRPGFSLFGTLEHICLYDPVAVRPDPSGRAASLLTADGEVPRSRLWALVKALSPFPLLDHWQEPLLDGLEARICTRLIALPSPAAGCASSIRVSLDDRFEDIVSMGVKAGVLALEPDAQPADGAARMQAIADSLPPRPPRKPLFNPGRIVMTPGVEDLLEHYPGLIERCLAAYLRGDWGAASEANLNDRAVASGEGRILAAYAIDPARPSAGYGDNTVWIITEADRSVTTLLLPHEY